MAKHRFALVGCGMVGQHHITAIKGVPRAKLVAICDVRDETARGFGEANGVPWFTDHNQMLADQPDITIVNICTPSGLHMKAALDVMAAGKHCVVEKPLEIALDKCDRMIEAADKAGVLLATVFPSRLATRRRSSRRPSARAASAR